MSTNKDDQNRKVEGYTRALLEAGRAEGRAVADLVQVQHAKKFSPEVLETLGAIQASEDVNLIEDIAATFQELLEKEDNTLTVTVTTTIALDDELRQKIIKKLEDSFNTQIYLIERVNPKILGGIVVEARDHRYDASVKTQLTHIKSRLSSSHVESEL
ncbi:MAG: ATP synthase F1 subunit delta [Atopobium sp.]|nr:ATP synthase F1 subunit delta [Atopobium sp.]